MGGNSGSRPDP